MTRRVLLWAFTLFFVFGCGGGGDDSYSGSRPGNAGTDSGNDSVAAGTTVFGRLFVTPILVSPDLPTAEFILSQKPFFDARGFRVSEGGEEVAWPDTPGSGYLIKLGTRTVIVEPDGSFQLEIPEGAGETVQVCHPSDERLEPVTFRLDALASTSEDEPKTLHLPLPFVGPCGMSEDDFCGEPAGRVSSQQVSAQLVSGNVLTALGTTYANLQYEPPTFNPNDPNVFWGVTQGDLGTYPPSQAWVKAHPHCPETDGYLQELGLDDFSDNVPFLTARQAEYLGSTCDIFVLHGACPNENPASDVEYQAYLLLGSPGSESLTPFDGAGLEDLHCIQNHKGRVCGMFTIGDVGVGVQGQSILSEKSGTVYVSPGQQGTLKVHNNGAFGITNVKASPNSPVSLSLNPVQATSGFNPPRVESVGQHTFRIHHYEEVIVASSAVFTHNYYPDLEFSFQVEETAQPGSEHVHNFSVDGRTATVTFKVIPFEISPETALLDPSRTETPENMSVNFTAGGHEDFLNEVTAGNAEVLYRWELQGSGQGSLEPTNDVGLSGQRQLDTTNISVRYLTNSEAQSGTKDELTCTLVVRSAAGQESLLAKATAKVVLGKAAITPDSATLMATQQQQFTALSAAPEGSTLIYEWSLLQQGLGTLSATTGEMVTYTARSQPFGAPLNDVIRLVVKIVDGDGVESVFATTDALVSLVPDNLLEIFPDQVELETTSTDTILFDLGGGSLSTLQDRLTQLAPATAIYRWTLVGTAGGTLRSSNNDEPVQGSSIETSESTVGYLPTGSANDGQLARIQLEILIQTSDETLVFGAGDALVTFQDDEEKCDVPAPTFGGDFYPGHESLPQLVPNVVTVDKNRLSPGEMLTVVFTVNNLNEWDWTDGVADAYSPVSISFHRGATTPYSSRIWPKVYSINGVVLNETQDNLPSGVTSVSGTFVNIEQHGTYEIVYRAPDASDYLAFPDSPGSYQLPICPKYEDYDPPVPNEKFQDYLSEGYALHWSEGGAPNHLGSRVHRVPIAFDAE